MLSLYSPFLNGSDVGRVCITDPGPHSAEYSEGCLKPGKSAWIALYAGEQGTVIDSVEVTISKHKRTQKDVDLDNFDFDVHVNGRNPLLLISGMPIIGKAKPTGEFLCFSLSEEEAENRTALVINGTRYTLQFEDGEGTSHLVISDGFHIQKLDTPAYEVKWAGDIDGDGLLDLLALTGGGGGGGKVLYLSSLRGSNAFVGLAGMFWDQVG
jgi:hypothetical protein